MSGSRFGARVALTVGVGALAAAVAAGPALASPGGGTPVPPGSPGDTNHNGLLDSSETPDNPDLPSQVPPGSPGDDNGNGQLDSSETPDNPDVP